MDTDRNLLFGVLALQVELIDTAQFAEACTAWASRKHVPLAELLVERGWLSDADRTDIECLLNRKISKHGGDPHASLLAGRDPLRDPHRPTAVRRSADGRGAAQSARGRAGPTADRLFDGSGGTGGGLSEGTGQEAGGTISVGARAGARGAALARRRAGDRVPRAPAAAAGTMGTAAQAAGGRRGGAAADRGGRSVGTNPRHPFYRDSLGLHYWVLADIRIGQTNRVEAVEAAEAYARNKPEGGEELYYAAELLARCMPLARNDAALSGERQQELARAYADRSIELLRAAIKQGFKDAGLLENAKAFDEFRARQDFQKLLAGLKAKC